MVVKSKKPQTPSKKEPASLKKKQMKPEDDDEALGDNDELMDLEENASMVKKQKENTPAKANKASPKGTPNGKQAAKPQTTPESKLKSKEGYRQRLQRTVCVKNLKPTMSDEDIVKFFKSVGKCTVTKRIRQKALGMVVFDKVEQAEKAITLNGHKLQDHTLVVEQSKHDAGTLAVLKEKKKLRSKKHRLARLAKLGKTIAEGKAKAKTADKKGDDKKPAEKKGGNNKPANKNTPEQKKNKGKGKK